MGNPLIPQTPPITEGDDNASMVLKHDTNARFWIAVGVLVQFVLLIGYITYRGNELADSQLILGAEISFVTLVLNYFFGSSSGSVTKSASSMDAASRHG